MADNSLVLTRPEANPEIVAFYNEPFIAVNVTK